GPLIFMYILPALLALPGAAISTCFMGYYAARKRFDGVGPGLAGGYVVAVILHGTYDASIFGAGLSFAQHDNGLAIGLFLLGAASILGGGIALRRRARLAVALDDVAFAQAAQAPPAAAAAARPPRAPR